MDSSFYMSEEDLEAMDLEQFFQENPGWDDALPCNQQEEDAVTGEEQTGGAHLNITDHVDITPAGKLLI